MLTLHGDRFVDRDMFMRYRGGGIGHKYMRGIEAAYANMSRKRVHHKKLNRRAVHQEDVVMDINGDGDGNSAESECRAERTGPQVGQDGQAGGQGDPTDNNEDGGSDEADDDYIPSDESVSSGISDSDDLDSDTHEGFEEIFGFGDP